MNRGNGGLIDPDGAGRRDFKRIRQGRIRLGRRGCKRQPLGTLCEIIDLRESPGRIAEHRDACRLEAGRSDRRNRYLGVVARPPEANRVHRGRIFRLMEVRNYGPVA